MRVILEQFVPKLLADTVTSYVPLDNCGSCVIAGCELEIVAYDPYHESKTGLELHVHCACCAKKCSSCHKLDICKKCAFVCTLCKTHFCFVCREGNSCTTCSEVFCPSCVFERLQDSTITFNIFQCPNCSKPDNSIYTQPCSNCQLPTSYDDLDLCLNCCARICTRKPSCCDQLFLLHDRDARRNAVFLIAEPPGAHARCEKEVCVRCARQCMSCLQLCCVKCVNRCDICKKLVCQMNCTSLRDELLKRHAICIHCFLFCTVTMNRDTKLLMINHPELKQPIQGGKKENDIHYFPEHATTMMQKCGVKQNVCTKKTQKRRRKKRS